MTDQFDWWRAAIAGTRGDIQEGEPKAGFYRSRRKGEQAKAIAYWYDTKNGSLRCHVDGADVPDQAAREQWPFAAKEPITHEFYMVKRDTGKWPDMDDSAFSSLPQSREVIGNNNPPTDDATVLKEQIEAAKGGVGDYAKIANDETAAKAQSLRSRLLELSATAEKKHKAEKQPHLDAGRAVDQKWFPLRDLAKGAADAIRSALSAWETEKDRRAREAMRVAEEARRKAEETGKPAPTPVAPPAPATPIKGAYGRAASVKQIRVATIVDQAKVYEAFKDNEAVKELLRKLAQRAVDDGYDVAGVTVELQRKVS